MQTFKFLDKEYEYFVSPYNDTRHNERAVELPIVMDYVKPHVHNKSNILEVGNTIHNYFIFPHTIVDKYESCEGVVNEDIISYEPENKFNLIFSISTMEHVGWDEDGVEKSGTKTLEAIERLKKMLLPDGEMIITFPLGHNTLLDEELKKGTNPFDKMYCMSRGSYNEWEEKPLVEVLKGNYGTEYVWGLGTTCIYCKKNFPIFVLNVTNIVVGVYKNA